MSIMGRWVAMLVVTAFVVVDAEDSASEVQAVRVASDGKEVDSVATQVASPMRLSGFWGDSATIVSTLPPTAPPVQVDSASSVLLEIFHALEEQLRNPKGQVLNAAVALIFGGILVVDGDIVFKWAVVFTCFILAALLAHHEASAFWNVGFENPIRICLGIECGIAAAWAAVRGIDGVMLVVGAMAGSGVALGIQNSLIRMGCLIFQTSAWVQFAWYSIFAFVFMLAISGKWHIKVLALVSSAFGGMLVSSAVSFFATLAAKKGQGAWVDFLLLLYSPDRQDVGIFTGSLQPIAAPWGPEVVCVDRALGCALWFILFLTGSAWQLYSLRRGQAQSRAQEKGGKVQSSSLKQSLIQKDLV